MPDSAGPPLRATDADREATVALLRRASVDGRLTVEELAERAEAAERARTYEELDALTADLEQPAPRPAPSTERPRQLAVFSGLSRRGRWRLARHARYVAVFGGVDLDLREAILPGPEVELEFVYVFSGVTVRVPEGVHVEVEPSGIFSGADVRVEGEAAPGAPVVRIRGVGVFGGLTVDSHRGGRRGLVGRLPPPLPPPPGL